MAKRRISQRQTRRIRQRQQQWQALLQEGDSTRVQRGLLIAQYGSHLTVLAEEEGKQYRCYVRQHLGDLVPGDRLIWEKVNENTGVVLAALPRQNELTRINRQGVVKPVAANLEQVVIVLAVIPEPQWVLLDSYLVMVEHQEYQPLIILNKRDLLGADPAIEERLNIYYQLGYAVLLTSIYQPMTITALQQHLTPKTSLFVGQSGVGKSSLLQTLVQDPTIAIGELMETTQLGAHTTSTARLYPLPTGGCVIDSPGIREFSIHHYTPDQIAHGFVEFRAYLNHCRFRDCTHIQEPGCAVLAAVATGAISTVRWESYKALLKDK